MKTPKFEGKVMHLAWFPVPVPSTCRCTYILPCVYAKTHRDTHWYPLFQHDALISISHPSHRVALVVVPGKSPRPPPFLPTRRPHLRGKRSSSPSKVRRGTRERTRRAAFISLSLSRSLAHLLPVGREDLANGGIFNSMVFSTACLVRDILLVVVFPSIVGGFSQVWLDFNSRMGR